MLVTAVMTTYKRSVNIVERALKSILNQTYENIETIIVDDSPEDFCERALVKDMVLSYSNKNVRYIAHENNMGACTARNTALAVAKGEFIGFLDDDDEWLPTKIEKQVAAFTSKDIALVYCNNVVLYDDTGERCEQKRRYIDGDIYKQLLFDNFIGSTSFPLIRTEALRSIGGFDVQMQSSQDYDVWLRLSQKYNFAFVDESLGQYHFHNGEQITKNPSKKIAGLERIISKNIDSVMSDKKVYWHRNIVLIPWYAASGNRKKAFCIWLKTVFKAPFNFYKNAQFFYSIFRAKKDG